ncbi:MAG TPA: L,D-transpeptidase family protein [Acidimicrobiales bacterium]|nr:L,D-transpeptidase family protein [Acidimicrobiales bacterium]
MLSWSGPTGQRGRHVEGTCAAVTGAAVPTKAGAPADVVGAGAAVVDGLTAVVAPVGAGAAVLEDRAVALRRWAAVGVAVAQAAAATPERRTVATSRAGMRLEPGTVAHPSSHRQIGGPGRRSASRIAVPSVSALVGATLVMSCASTRPVVSARHARPDHARAVTTTTATAPEATTATTAAPASPVTPATTAPPAPPPTAPAPLLVTRLAGVGDAAQVVAVVASGYGTTVATLTAYQRQSGGWQQVFGPWTAELGYHGFAPPGQKAEGDGRTPTGSFGFGFFFGVDADPGVHFPFRPVTGNNIVWDDDPQSPLYNQWVDDTSANPGANPEPMDNTPAYDYGAVIAYNTSPVVPGAGSAIFLHVSTGGPTAGCVSIPVDELLQVLRWLDPAQQPRIVMGPAAAVTS